jgi:gamma-glutamyltranspeptidase/glutathione hydrolase
MQSSNTNDKRTDNETGTGRSDIPSKTTRRRFLATGAGVGFFSLALSDLNSARTSPSAVSAKLQEESPEGIATAMGHGGAAASLDPRASEVAIEILKRGGNAVDAGVAAAAMLGVVQPFTTGIGGGGFLVIYLAEQDETVTIDSRGMAPKEFKPERFQDLPIPERFTGPLAAGVPGLVHGWKTMLREYGSLPLSRLLQPAITTAQSGFRVDRAHAARVESQLEEFRCFTSTKEQFLTADCEAPNIGERVRNRELAQTYQKIAREGVEAFYEGDIAEAIVDAVMDPPVAPGCKARPGKMTLADLAAYKARIHEPITVPYRGYDVVGMGMSTTGGVAVEEVLQILERFDLGTSRERTLHYFLEASRIAFADRTKYIGTAWEWDPSVPLSEYPVERLTSEEYAAARRELIDATAAQDPYLPGDPCEYPDTAADPYPPGDACESQSTNSLEFARVSHQDGRTATESKDVPQTSTTHLSVSDCDGNIVSYTSSIIFIGGSAVTVPEHGFLLNNVLVGAVPPAAPGDRGGRPYSNTSPTIVFDDGDPVLTVGSPGGADIIEAVLQVLINYLDFGMDLPRSVAAPRLSSTNANVTSAANSALDPSVVNALETRGHELDEVGQIGEPTGIAFLPDGRVQAVADPVYQREGSALVGGCPGKAEPSTDQS